MKREEEEEASVKWGWLLTASEAGRVGVGVMENIAADASVVGVGYQCGSCGKESVIRQVR